MPSLVLASSCPLPVSTHRGLCPESRIRTPAWSLSCVNKITNPSSCAFYTDLSSGCALRRPPPARATPGPATPRASVTAEALGRVGSLRPRPLVSECLRLFPETIICSWARVSSVCVQLFPDALGCVETLSTTSSSSHFRIFGCFLKSSAICGEHSPHSAAPCSLSSG